jgi:hypothetical protein
LLIHFNKGFSWNTHIKNAAHGPGYVSAIEKHNNWIMAKVRIAVEWSNAKIIARNPFLTRVHLLKCQRSGSK